MSGPNAGRRGGRWQKLRRQLQAERRPCWLCHQPIDYTAEWPDTNSFSVDHERPLSVYPEGAEDPGNLRACHLGCNASRGTKAPRQPVRNPSRNW